LSNSSAAAWPSGVKPSAANAAYKQESFTREKLPPAPAGQKLFEKRNGQLLKP
jgi:hypothetical protein